MEEVKGYCMSNQGANLLIDQRDYTYSMNAKSRTTCRLYWQCTVRRKAKCKARAVTIGNKITKLSGEHTHHPYIA